MLRQKNSFRFISVYLEDLTASRRFLSRLLANLPNRKPISRSKFWLREPLTRRFLASAIGVVCVGDAPGSAPAPIGVFRLAESAVDCAGSKVFSCRYCFVICNWNQRKANHCIILLPDAYLSEWQLAQRTTACVMSVILS